MTTRTLLHRIRPLLPIVASAMAGAIALAVAAPTAGGQGAPSAADDRTAVIGVAEALLRAISTRDSAAAARLLIPGMVTVSIPVDAPSPAPRLQDRESMLRLIAGSPQRFLERMWNPSARVHGTLATVETPYDFHIDGKFSHCGVDVFSMMKTADGWRVASLTWTTQRTGCAPSPLGPPA